MTRGPLRVLYVMHSGALAGSAESLCLLLESLPPGSVLATVICPPGDVVPRLRRTGATVRSIPGVSMFHSIQGVPLRGPRLLELARTAWMTRYGGAIRAAIRETRPDIVHLNERGMIQAARIASREGVPVVLHARSVAERREGWVRRLSTAAIHRYASRVVAIDESVRSSLADLPGIEVIYNPIDRGSATATEPRRRPGTPVRVTFLAGLQTFKGVDDLLESALRLRDRRDILFQIAGENSRPEAFHRSVRGKVLHLFGFAPDVESRLRRWVARHGMAATVLLLGRVRPEEVLAETDILVFPSHLDGPGRSVYEAGVRGIPAVVSLLHRLEDVVVHEETGLIVPERDPPALAAAIARLADDQELRRRLGDNARRRYRLQFDPAAIAERMLALYREVASGPGKDSFESGDRSPDSTTSSTVRGAR
jgi:glycosyltransferase involved in cell wall biosynthesis